MVHHRRRADAAGWRVAAAVGLVFIAIGCVLVGFGIAKDDHALLAWAFPFGLVGAGMIRPDFILRFTLIWRRGQQDTAPQEEPPEEPPP
jgi:hypothetical protein